MAFDWDSSALVAGTEDGGIHIWDTESGEKTDFIDLINRAIRLWGVRTENGD